MLIIRKETQRDYEEIYEMVKKAFATTTHSDGTEQDYLNELRNKNCFLPELALVAQTDGKIVGHVVLYEMQVNNAGKSETGLVLSPLSVHPCYFGRGIGTRLIDEGLKRAKENGYKAVFLCGDYDYYSKRGFVPTYQYGIYHEKDVGKTANWCMVKELEKGFLTDVAGTVNIE